MKAQGNKEYAPFTVTVDPTKATGGTVALLLARGFEERRAAAAAGADAKDDKKDDKKNPPKRPEFAYEDVSFVPSRRAARRCASAVVHRAGRSLRRLRGREGADLDAEECAAGEGFGHQADRHGAGFLEQRARPPAR